MSTKTSHATKPYMPARATNSTDMTRGEPLALRAQKRRAELQLALDKLPADELRGRTDLDLAIAEVDELLTGDVDHLAEATAAGINRWLEHSKHLAEVTPKARPRPAP